MQRLMMPLNWHQFCCIWRHQNLPGANHLAPLIVAPAKFEAGELWRQCPVSERLICYGL
jgi:hypothetical protein